MKKTTENLLTTQEKIKLERIKQAKKNISKKRHGLVIAFNKKGGKNE